MPCGSCGKPALQQPDELVKQEATKDDELSGGTIAGIVCAAVALFVIFSYLIYKGTMHHRALAKRVSRTRGRARAGRS